MKTTVKRTLTAAIVAGVTAFAGQAGAQEAELPRTMMWSAYDVGSSGYTEASAVADALIKEYGVRIRIMPSGTSIGRLLPLKTGRVQYGWLANEVYFATEALYDFSAREWGPQDLRVVMGRPAGFGIGVAADTGVKELADLKGKRVSRIQANPSVNLKVEAILAFAGLTWDDVEVVEMPSYGAALRGVVEGQNDAAGGVPTAGIFRELEASSRGIVWPNLPTDNKEGWDRVRKVAPFFSPATETIGAGLSKEHPAQLIAYKYPMITTYASTSEEDVYNLTKAVVESYDIYKDANKVMPRWDAQSAGKTPADAPFHPGAVKYLKEIGVWTDEDEAWNQKRLERLKAVQAAWDAAEEEAIEKEIADADWPDFWASYRKEHLN
ncbi:TAXI family TRAP transporter solute-binding subunit [Kaustia mangrovi]|uniref:TAXI family TRAP transporter solute-binding subunit n=1 Tax=Kaustia mangrovi TaxID=2593653 RepID=A0A7S8C484_9HYPH|nr:TAXI family TRAP transporter solute-binding subunit [Kaustia mangrovi]QPC43103.1 TAXI family TRAP transporter solute-binding subunit [Kaustia mangrovi]